MAITLLELDEAATLLPHREAILTFFEFIFKRPMPPELWEWFYLQQPYETPLVTVAYKDDHLIGHYALIPVTLKNAKGDTLAACQSISTMIDSRHADMRLFESLAKRTYERAQERGYELVFGFPNQNSKLYFQRILRWQLHDSDYVALLEPQQMLDDLQWCTYHRDPDRFYNNLSDETYRNYRLMKPLCPYKEHHGSLVKAYDNGHDLLHVNADTLALLPPKKYHILVDGSHSAFSPFKVFDYPFGGRWLDNPKRQLPEFKKEMLLSDVF